MLYEDKTQNNILIDMKSTVQDGINTDEGTLIDQSFRGAAAELERVYIALSLLDKNGYAKTADREHLILRAKEKGIEPYAATNAEWEAKFNTEVKMNERFSAGKLTYLCVEKLEEKTYKLVCEQSGTVGNTKQNGMLPLGFIEGFESGELTKLLNPARDEEKTEAFRARYLSFVSSSQAFGGNREQYKQIMYKIGGVGACKIYRVMRNEKRIKIYFLDSSYQTPDQTLVSTVQEIVDPIGKQGEGEGEAAIFHIVDICPCVSVAVDLEAEITIDTGYTWEGLKPEIEAKLESYYQELAKTWENEEYIIVRILKINTAIASVEGVVDIQDTKLNGKAENLLLEPNEVPVRGGIVCGQ